MSEESTNEDIPYSGRTLPGANLYPLHSAGKLQDRIASLMIRDIKPTEEQRTVLEARVERVEVEAQEEQSGTRETSEQEPLFDLVHGFPGTGKTELIFWIR